MRRSMLGTVVLVALGVLLLAAPVAAFPLTNCALEASSIGSDGSQLDTIANGAADATQADPFIVEWNGTISYSGSAQVEMKNNTWAVAVFGIPTSLRGGADNTDDNRDGRGTVGVSANAPFRITGLYYVSGSITGSGGTCSGSGWFKFAGDPIGTIPFLAALLLTLVGAGMLAVGARGHSFTAIFGGLLVGLGLATLLVLFSTLPLGSATPLVVFLLGLVLGVVIAHIGRRGSRGRDALRPSNPDAPTPA